MEREESRGIKNWREGMKKIGYFFDMDGVLFDSMPIHAKVWEEVMTAHGLHFTAEDCYINEGRTGQDVIREAILQCEHRQATEDEIWAIYHEKTAAFQAQGVTKPMKGVADVLRFLQQQGAQIWIVTGSGQKSLFDTLNEHFPNVFSPDKMITAYDVTNGKPNPEPYLKAWERSGLDKTDCCVIENAPLGVRAGKAAGLFTIGVNTGPLPDSALLQEGADIVFPDMAALLHYLQEEANTEK